MIDSATDTTKEVAPANAIPYPVGISWRGRGTVSSLPEAVGMSLIEALRRVSQPRGIILGDLMLDTR